MKIIHLIWSYTLGGAETMLVEIINRQHLKANISLIIINNLINENLLKTVNSNVKIIKIGRPQKSKNIFYLFKLWLKISIINPDVIHCHNDTLYKLLFGFKNKAYLTVHDSIFNTDCLLHYKKIFAISKTVKRQLTNKNIGSILVYNGIDTEKITIKEIFNQSPFRIIQIGRLVHTKKGQDVLIEAIKHLVHDLGYKNIELDFIGIGQSLAYLKNLVKIYSLENHVKFRGEIDIVTIYENLRNYNLLVQPSIYEGFGLTVTEAMAAQVPVLVSDIEGPMEIINNGQYGYFFKTNDPIDCALRIKEIIDNYNFYTDQQRLSTIREHVINNFDISKTAENYLHHYL